MKAHQILPLILLGLTFASCNPIASTTDIPVSNMTPTNSSQNDMTQMPSDANLQNLIGKAKEDLAQRLSVAAPQINIVEITEVEWSDSSLDCPQPGMDYLQVITPGYRIVLNVDDKNYEYHSNQNSYVVYCENPRGLISPDQSS